MSIISFSLSFIGSSYLPIILLTLILGFLVLIINENNKFSSKEKDENTDWQSSVDNLVNSEDENKVGEKLEVDKKDTEDGRKSEKISDNDSSHSHNEDKEIKEDEENSKVKVKKIKKIGCSSSGSKTGGCSTRKKKVEEVIILSFSNDEECATKLLDCLDDDITCRIKSLNSDDFDVGCNNYKDAVDLCFILLTSEENINQVESLIEKHTIANQKLESEETHVNSFSYSILYINQETRDLKVLEDALNNIGGEMWRPSISISEDKQTIESQVLEEFSNSLLKDIKKSRKKCCGTSCKTKTTDIEDLLPLTTAVET